MAKLFPANCWVGVPQVPVCTAVSQKSQSSEPDCSFRLNPQSRLTEAPEFFSTADRTRPR